MTDRRLLLLALGCALGGNPLPMQAQARIPRVGVLSFGARPKADPMHSFQQGMRELGYVEGQNLILEERFAEGRPERLAAMAAELVRLKVDLIVAEGPGPLDAARKATRTIPIVAVSGSDPVREGWAQSLAHPGGNVTGLTVTYPELGPKRLEILKEAFPGHTRIAMLIAPGDLADATQGVVQEMQDGARRLGMQLQVFEVRSADDVDAAFRTARQARAQALLVIATNVTFGHLARITELAVADRLPSISDFALVARSGLLMSYGADLEWLLRRSAVHADKILKGARPGDLAIERPAKLQLVINLRTAKALGVTIPQSMLVRADELIQ